MTTVVSQEEQPISRTYQYRKVMKPMLERKRRARINHCLDELKELLVGALQAEGESVSRLEKADVLELTVRHLHKLRRVQQLNENSASERFKAGFITCTNEVSKYMQNLSSNLDLSVSARLLSHLDHCIHQIEAQTAAASMIAPNGPLSSGSSSASTIVLQSSQISPLHHHLAQATAAVGSSPASGYNSLSSVSLSGSSSLSPSTHTRNSPNLNLLTTYTPPTSPASSPINKYVYHPYAAAAAAAGHRHLIFTSSAKDHKSPSPAHIQNSTATTPTFVTSADQQQQQQQVPLSLCTKPSLRMDRNNNDEPFDLSNGPWRPW